MQNNLMDFIEEIRKNTGVEVAVYSTDGACIFGEPKEKIDTKFCGIYVNAEKKSTFFYFEYKSNQYIGRIKGITQSEKTIASFIIKLAEKDSFLTSNKSKTELLKSVLFGELNSSEVENFKNKYNIEDDNFCVLTISDNGEHTEDIYELIKSYISNEDSAIRIDETHVALIKKIERDAEYRSLNEYAEFLIQMIFEEISFTPLVAIGGNVKKIKDLSVSFSQAKTAESIYVKLGENSGVVSYKNFLLGKMLEELPKYRLKEFLDILKDDSANEIFEDEEMIKTAEEFFKNNLNVSETSRKIYLHRNTLIYRLDKIERGTGLDIRKFDDAVSFYLINIIREIIK
ncbi:MAG: helix-turn-helix domain-containing protein [Clostridia bacterium]|nr:helix-turn-helix domain-containing protein [Clostridia bacterium]